MRRSCTHVVHPREAFMMHVEIDSQLKSLSLAVARFQSSFLSRWFSLCALFFSFCIQECDWQAENNMRERSSAINAFTAEEVGDFYKDNVSSFTMTRGGVNKRGKCRRSIKQFIAWKIYNHRVFITVYWATHTVLFTRLKMLNLAHKCPCVKKV